ncbi:MAG: cation diffusion facilitator family transporter [Acidaminococcaceae bacterium]|nr:cation diffusion facilitator family transporter [Acidaminococcaceae bacterium]MDO4936198.1 cation diffusion facilitator family transporter [Phascolarctobacterium sp.]
MHHNHNHTLNHNNKQRTLIVIILTILTMGAEIIYGYATNSIGLLADGYHMGTHAFALGITYGAYLLAEHLNSANSKIETLAGYTSAIFLTLSGVWIIIEALHRLFNPLTIDFNEAITVAVIGLAINSICILIMGKGQGTDYNFQAAYYHILADAVTSVFAIIALLSGKFYNIIYLDPVAGILGGLLILSWSYKLIYKSFFVLTDLKPQ